MIVCLGDLALDVAIRPSSGVLRGSDVPGTVRLAPGGSAANTAVWAARLGADVTFIGAVGADQAGDWLRADLGREGVTAHLQVVAAPTASIAVLIEAGGERAMIADRGAADLLLPEHIEPGLFPPGCRLHLPAYSLFGALRAASLRAVGLCREEGGSVGVDSSSVGPLRSYGRDPFLALLDEIAPDVLFVNAEEGAYLSGHDEPDEGLVALRRVAGLVVWKLGAAGALALGAERAAVPGLLVPPVDSTGAGDAFAAACTVALLDGAPLAEALARANRLAAWVVGRLGARPPLDDTLADLRERGPRVAL